MNHSQHIHDVTRHDMTRMHAAVRFDLEILEARRLLASTNDLLITSQYALAATAAVSAWDQTTGSSAVVVADIDTGADYTHEDLYDNIWINQAEIPTSLKSKLKDTDGDGVISFYDLNAAADRDYMNDVNGNGYIDAGDLLNPTSAGGWEDGVNGKSNANDIYVDDIIGWDFAEDDNDPFDDAPSGEAEGNGGHGTHTAGIIGATGNNGVGISGVIQKVSEMIVRIFNDDGESANDSVIADAIRYSADSGAKVSNNSWGGTFGTDGDALYQAIKYAGTKGQLFVAAAGNDGRNLDSSRFNDFPSEYNLANIISVAATTASGSLASWSNYGSTAVDVAAPGSNILSTLPGDTYGKLSGTSMAAPMVTGAAALMLAANSKLTAAQIKSQLINGSNETSRLNNRTVSDGQIDVANAIAGISGTDVADNPTNPIGPITTRPPLLPRLPWYFYSGPRSIDDVLASA